MELFENSNNHAIFEREHEFSVLVELRLNFRGRTHLDQDITAWGVEVVKM